VWPYVQRAWKPSLVLGWTCILRAACVLVSGLSNASLKTAAPFRGGMRLRRWVPGYSLISPPGKQADDK
jgi:hypothetical protein